MSLARLSGSLALAWWLLGIGGLRADPAPAAGDSAAAPTPAPADAPKGFLEGDSPLPDPGGLRAKLAAKGIAIAVIYAGEVFGNPVGGYRQGAVFDGLLTAGVDIDFGKLAGWDGLKFHALAYETHGPSGTAKYTRDLNNYSSIDAYDSARLCELWLQTSLFHNVVNFRIGQESVDAEFATTIGGALFIHSNFGALPTLTLNVPTPTFPEAVPAARLRLNTPDARFYFQTGVYAGNPDADRDHDPNPDFRAGTAYNDNGIRFPISGNQGALIVSEAGFLTNYSKDSKGLPGGYRIGGFYHTGEFSDEHFDPTMRSLADPLSTHHPRSRNGDGGIYAVAEQVLWRPPGAPGGQEDVSQVAAAPIGNAEDSPLSIVGTPAPTGPQLRAFGRLGVGEGDRSLTDFYAEIGLNYRALIPGRAQDVFGLGFTYTGLSDDLRDRVRDENHFDGTHLALPDYECICEATYQVNLGPWLSVQPDLQYIIHPGGSGRYDNALVMGVRTVISF